MCGAIDEASSSGNDTLSSILAGVAAYGPSAPLFPPSSFDLESFINDCKSRYGVPPRPHWITTYYGGHDMKLVLHRFASNIIFFNGLRDPYSSGGVLHNISDNVVAVYKKTGPIAWICYVETVVIRSGWSTSAKLR
ncbi:hypothetical protein CerSpe_198800 [Prunus speciosa]